MVILSYTALSKGHLGYGAAISFGAIWVVVGLFLFAFRSGLRTHTSVTLRYRSEQSAQASSPISSTNNKRIANAKDKRERLPLAGRNPSEFLSHDSLHPG